MYLFLEHSDYLTILIVHFIGVDELEFVLDIKVSHSFLQVRQARELTVTRIEHHYRVEVVVLLSAVVATDQVDTGLVGGTIR
jgi:hypothetical protein